MTTEDDFQGLLDENPDDSDTRSVFSDWLQDRGDDRWEGYRALGLLKLCPWKGESVVYPWFGFHDGKGYVLVADQPSDAPRWCSLPDEWFRVARRDSTCWITTGYGLGGRRQDLEDWVARKFLLLSPEIREELLAGGVLS